MPNHHNKNGSDEVQIFRKNGAEQIRLEIYRSMRSQSEISKLRTIIRSMGVIDTCEAPQCSSPTWWRFWHSFGKVSLTLA